MIITILTHDEKHPVMALPSITQDTLTIGDALRSHPIFQILKSAIAIFNLLPIYKYYSSHYSRDLGELEKSTRHSPICQPKSP
jgi:hypothetical protein